MAAAAYSAVVLIATITLTGTAQAAAVPLKVTPAVVYTDTTLIGVQVVAPATTEGRKRYFARWRTLVPLWQRPEGCSPVGTLQGGRLAHQGQPMRFYLVPSRDYGTPSHHDFCPGPSEITVVLQTAASPFEPDATQRPVWVGKARFRVLTR